MKFSHILFILPSCFSACFSFVFFFIRFCFVISLDFFLLLFWFLSHDFGIWFLYLLIFFLCVCIKSEVVNNLHLSPFHVIFLPVFLFCFFFSKFQFDSESFGTRVNAMQYTNHIFTLSRYTHQLNWAQNIFLFCIRLIRQCHSHASSPGSFYGFPMFSSFSHSI